MYKRAFERSYYDTILDEISGGRREIVECEEEEEGDFGDNDFVGLCGLFDGDPSLLEHNLVRMLNVSRFLIERYIPAFHMSGLAAEFVRALGSHRYNVRVYVLQIVTNLSSNEEVPEYAEKLVENNILNEILLILKSCEENELVFWSLRCLTNFAFLSISLRDQIINEISPDFLCALAQTNQLDSGCHDELLKLFRELAIDLNEEHVCLMLETILTFLPDFFERKPRLSLEILFVLANYNEFYPYFCQHNLLDRMFSLFLKTNDITHEKLLIGVFIMSVQRDPEAHSRIFEKCRDLLNTPNISLFIGVVTFFLKLFECRPQLFFPEILGIIYERQKPLSIRFKTELTRILMQMLINLSPDFLLGYPASDMVDFLGMNDTETLFLALQVLSRTLDYASRAESPYANEFVTNGGLSQLDEILDMTTDDSTRSLISTIINTHFST